MEDLKILTTRELLELLRAQHIIKGLPDSDYYISKVMGVTPQAGAKWLKYGQPMSDDKAFLLADELKLPYSYVLLCMHFERAKTDEARQAMQEIADKFLKVGCFLVAVSALLNSALLLALPALT